MPLFVSSVTSSDCSQSTDSKMLSSNKKRHSSCHSTIINAPIGVIWESLSDINSWGWNSCVRLDAACVVEGLSGKAMVHHDGKWRQKPFTFEKVERKKLTFSWSTTFGRCICTNTMKLIQLGPKRSQLKHIQEFRGGNFGQRLGILHPFNDLRKNVCYMNEGLKNHVESLYFNSLLCSISSRDMKIEKEDPESTTVGTELSSELSGASFWETPKHLRQQLVQCFVEDPLDDPFVQITISHDEYE